MHPSTHPKDPLLAETYFANATVSLCAIVPKSKTTIIMIRSSATNPNPNHLITPTTTNGTNHVMVMMVIRMTTIQHQTIIIVPTTIMISKGTIAMAAPHPHAALKKSTWSHKRISMVIFLFLFMLLLLPPPPPAAAAVVAIRAYTPDHGRGFGPNRPGPMARPIVSKNGRQQQQQQQEIILPRAAAKVKHPHLRRPGLGIIMRQPRIVNP